MKKNTLLSLLPITDFYICKVEAGNYLILLGVKIVKFQQGDLLVRLRDNELPRKSEAD